MASEADRIEQDADRADWLERIARLIYEAAVDSEPAFEHDLRAVLAKYETAWHIKTDWPFPGWDDPPRR